MRSADYYYSMHILFEQQIYDHSFTLKCRPSSTARQKVEKENVRILPECRVSEGFDGFGNPLIYGRIAGESAEFDVVSQGCVMLGCADYEEEADVSQLGLFRYPTALTAPGPGIQALCLAHPEWKDGSLSSALSIMHAVHHSLVYMSNSTNIHTNAEEAYRAGKGVCQDYAHIMISACRLSGIPARYAVGVLEGEGKSHAWTEVCCEGKWYGLDPTNDLPVTDSHIRFSAGRDFADCRINHGIFRGTSKQKQDVYVLVKGNRK